MTWKFATVEGVRCAVEYFLINIKFLTSFLKEISAHLEEVSRRICSFWESLMRRRRSPR